MKKIIIGIISDMKKRPLLHISALLFLIVVSVLYRDMYWGMIVGAFMLVLLGLNQI